MIFFLLESLEFLPAGFFVPFATGVALAATGVFFAAEAGFWVVFLVVGAYISKAFSRQKRKE